MCPLTGGKDLDIVGDHALEIGNTIGPCELKQTTVTEVEQSHAGSDRLVFQEGFAKMKRKGPPVLLLEVSTVVPV